MIERSRPKRILVLSPHTDDGELGAGGTIARFAEEGESIHVIAFSAPDSPLRDEAEASSEALGVESLTVLDFENKNFPMHRQEIMDAMLSVSKVLRPDLVLCPSLFDTHQDHRVVAEEAMREFKYTSVWGWEQPWNNPSFGADAFVRLGDGHINAKLRALSCYKSQKLKAYMERDSIVSLARVRGMQIRVRYAEAFSIMRFVI